MSVSVAVFVPEGVVFASDGISETRMSNDSSVLHRQGHTFLFSYRNRFMICVQGSGYVNGIPCACSIKPLIASLSESDINDIDEFVQLFATRISKELGENANLSMYVAGVKMNHGAPDMQVYMLSRDCCQIINKDASGKSVFNYHSVGSSNWIDKILLHTHFDDGKGMALDFRKADIQFNQFSLANAKEFAIAMLNISNRMDHFVLRQEIISENIQYGILTFDGECHIYN